jgi:hypothetical protein
LQKKSGLKHGAGHGAGMDMALQPDEHARVLQAAAAQHFIHRHALAEPHADAGVAQRVRAHLVDLDADQAPGHVRPADLVQTLAAERRALGPADQQPVARTSFAPEVT